MQDNWDVKLIKQGRVINIVVVATSQNEARQVAERMYPDYRAMTAQRK